MTNEEMFSRLLSAIQAIDNRLGETKGDLIKEIQNLDTRMKTWKPEWKTWILE